MIWTDFFNKVVILNLPERADRLDRIESMLYEYGIECIVWEATKHDDGRIGLVQTMKDVFTWSLKKGYDRLFIMEDDCDIIVSPHEFHNTMNACVDDLNDINWDLFYAGIQHPVLFDNWYSPNLLRVNKGYSTHSVGYSKRAMEFVIDSHIQEPIDNFLVNNFQKYNTSFCSYPLLCSQVAGYSNIGNDYIDWGQFIKPIFEKNTRDILHKRFKKNT